MTNSSLPSVTISIASSFCRYLSVRQSLASSTEARASWPGVASSFFSKRSRRVKASAVEPAKPATTSKPPGDRRRTLRAVPLMTVGPRLTWPSPATTTSPPLRTPIIVVPCQPGNWSSDMDRAFRIGSSLAKHIKTPKAGRHRPACAKFPRRSRGRAQRPLILPP